MLKKTMLIAIISLLFASGLKAQELLTPAETYSKKKTAYITMTDSTKIECTIKKLKQKQGFIVNVIIRKDGNEIEINPSEIMHMYIPIQDLEIAARHVAFIQDVTKWGNENLDSYLLEDGYVYFEQVKIIFRKKNITTLLQLLNPDFCNSVKVYEYPWSESQSASVNGITVADRGESAYYVKPKGDEIATYVYKSKYKKLFSTLWAGCPDLIESTEKIKLKDLTDHIIQYTLCIQDAEEAAEEATEQDD